MYQGSCEYILTQDHCAGRNGSFLVKVQNIPCGVSGVTCTKATNVILEDVVISMERGKNVKVTSHSGDLLPTNTDKYRIYSGFLFLTLTTNVGLTVLWDYGTRVYVTLDAKFKGERIFCTNNSCIQARQQLTLVVLFGVRITSNFAATQ